MEVFAGIIVIGIFFSPLIALLVLRRRLKNIESKVDTLQNRLKALEPVPFESDKVQQREEPMTDRQEASPIVDLPRAVVSPPPSFSPSDKNPKHSPHKKIFPLLGRLEKQFLNNWTGFLGAIIVVLGVGFLSIYAALKMTEFYRFILLLLLASLPAGLSFFLRGREKWTRQAAWMLSISGAIFLFACLGSGGIPGLQWINNSYASLALLILGVVVNLGLGSLGKKQSFASFHTLLSLMALAVVSPGTPTLFMAVVICLYAVLQTYKEKWDLHILLTISGFFLYHLFWIFTLRQEVNYELLRIQGVVAVILVFAAAALIHYRKNYATEKFELFPFLVHLINWSYFTVGMILYLGEYQWRTIPLILGALTAFLLADRAHHKGITWLKTTDVMITQVLTVTAFLTLMGWDVQPVLIWGLIFAESVLFVRIMIGQKNYLLFRVGVNLSYLAALILMVVCINNPGFAGAIITGGAILLTLFLQQSLALPALGKKDGSQWLKGDTLPLMAGRFREFSLTGFFAGLQGLTLITVLVNRNLPNEAGLSRIVLALAVPFIILLLFRLSRQPSRGLFAGALLFLIGFSLTGWDELLSVRSAWEYMAIGFSLFAVGGASVLWLKRPGKIKARPIVGLVVLSLSLILLSLALLHPVSPFLPGLFWLAAALLLIFIPNLSKDIRSMIFLFLAAYFIRHFAVHIHLEEAWGVFKGRYFMDFLVLPVLFLWYRGKSFSHPYIMELGLIFTTAILFIEVPLPWISVLLGVLALILLLSRLGKEDTSRIIFYSLLLNWMAIGGLMGEVAWRESYAVFPLSGSLAVFVNLGYIILFIYSSSLDKMILPSFLRRFIKLTTFLNRRIHGLLLYPLTLGTAFFIFAVFPAETLTLIWALECFLIFSASIFLGEEHFRYVSQGGLFLCVLRLVLVDLSGSTTLARGMVFLGVGVLMLGVNALYNRYKDRFVKK